MIHLTGTINFDGQTIPVDLTSDNRTELAGALLALLPPEENGIVRGATNAAPPPPPEYFSRNPRRSANPAAPLEIRTHIYDWLTIDRLTGNPAIDWGLIGLRFPHMADIIDPKYLRAAERYLAGDEAALDPFEADIATLLFLPQGDLIKSDGSLNLSAVARAVNRRTGGSDWSYVQDLAAALGEAWAEAKAA